MKYSSRVGWLRPKYSEGAEPYKMLRAFCVNVHVTYIFSQSTQSSFRVLFKIYEFKVINNVPEYPLN